MANERAASILSELLRFEQCNMAVRLLESTVFVPRFSTDADSVVHRIARAVLSHCESLTEAILDLGGQPGPRGGSMQSADLHFMEVSAALPRFIREHRALVRHYEVALTKLADSPNAASLVSHIADVHRQELKTLEALHGGQPAGAV